jgi:hypothetical protein
MLSRHKVDVISGHTHENEHVFEGGVHEHVQGTVCGAWWTGPICHDGTPAGYGIYEVRGESIQWTYKGTGQPLDHQLRVYGPGSDPDANDELIANVWNWDPQWTVEWIADGVARGPMARRTGFDPLSVQLHKGDDLPKRRTWVEPHLTSHLFYAPAGASTREVQVRATDRFGRTFTRVASALGLSARGGGGGVRRYPNLAGSRRRGRPTSRRCGRLMAPTRAPG